MRLFVALVLAMISAPLTTQSYDTMMAARELGTALAAEQKCGLSYDQAAIAHWNDTHTDPDDMGFAAMLGALKTGAEHELAQHEPGQPDCALPVCHPQRTVLRLH